MADIKDNVDVFRRKVKESRVNPMQFINADSDSSAIPNVSCKIEEETPVKPDQFVDSSSGFSSTATLSESSNSHYQNNYASEPLPQMHGKHPGLGFEQAADLSTSVYQPHLPQSTCQGLWFAQVTADSMQPMSKGEQDSGKDYGHPKFDGASDQSNQPHGNQTHGKYPHSNQAAGEGSKQMGKRVRRVCTGGSKSGNQTPGEDWIRMSKQAHQVCGGERKSDDVGTVCLEDILLKEEETTAFTLLRRTERFNKITFAYDFREEEFQWEPRVTCSVYYGQQLLGSGTASNKATARVVADEKTLEYLRSCCYTIFIKRGVTHKTPVVSRADVMGEEVSRIPPSTSVSKLTKNMGCSADEDGKHGQGISEPVSKETVNREGLSLPAEKGGHKNFLSTIKPIIHTYAHSDTPGALVFAKDFSKEERTIIHSEGQKVGLKCQSQGKRDSRFIVLSHRCQVTQLLKHVRSMGGETEKYRLIPPHRNGNQSHGNQTPGEGWNGMGKKVDQVCGGERKSGNGCSVNLEDILIQDEETPAFTILHCTESFNKISFDYDIREEDLEGEHRVTYSICYGPELLGSSTDSHKTTAKEEAGLKALEYLRSRCYTVFIRHMMACTRPWVSRDDLIGNAVGGIPSSNTGSRIPPSNTDSRIPPSNTDSRIPPSNTASRIPPSNIGSKMLRKMGWSGGGVGKHGQGISEPVTIETVIKRAGLGLQAEKGVNKNFSSIIKSIIHRYAHSDEQEDLIFSADFCKKERSVIEREGQKIGLKSQRCGQGQGRYVMLSRNRKVTQLCEHLKSIGGETEKYRLIPPHRN